MKVLAIIFIFIVSFNLNTYSQTNIDSVYMVNNYSHFSDTVCSLKEQLFDAIQEDNTKIISRIINTKIIFPGLKYSETKLVTKREMILLNFYMKEYDELLDEIEVKKDFFEYSEQINYNFDCFNLVLQYSDLWKNKSNQILDDIKTSNLTDEQKDVLICYWNSILLFIQNEKVILLSVNDEAKKIKAAYPNSDYSRFIKKLSKIKQIYRPTGYSISFGVGKNFLLGDISNIIDGSGIFGMELGIYSYNWNFKAGWSAQSFRYLNSNIIDKIDDIQIIDSKHIGYEDFFISIGYNIQNRRWFKIQPFISGNLYRFWSYADVPNPDETITNGDRHFNFSIGSNLSVKLINNLTRKYPKEWSVESKKVNYFYNPVFVNFRVGYFPNVFNIPININGGIVYWKIGLEWIIGIDKPKYSLENII